MSNHIHLASRNQQRRAIVMLALALGVWSGCETSTAPTGSPVGITLQNLYMRTLASQTLTASGGDGARYTWSLQSNPAGPSLQPSSDTKTAVLTAGSRPASIQVTAVSGGESAFIEVNVIGIITRADDFKYVRPAGSTTNPSETGRPLLFGVYFRPQPGNFRLRTCQTEWDGIDTFRCLELDEIPPGRHLVLIPDLARRTFVNGVAVPGSETVGNDIFLNGEKLSFDVCEPISAPPAARCAYFIR